MSIGLFPSESKFLERSRIALTNAENHLEIKPLLAPFGVDEPRIAAGWVIYDKAKSSWEANKKEDGETSLASIDYKRAYGEFEHLFFRHRQQSLIFFKKRPDYLIKLGVKGNFPSKYNVFFDKSKEFYLAIQSNPEIQEQLLLCKITPEIVADCLVKHRNLLKLRAIYDKESGESQATTVSKNADLLNLKVWMEDFDILAKIALYDKPQLLEVLGIFVRS